MTQMGDSYDLTMAAATLRSNTSDVRALLGALCDELTDAVGERLKVQRGSGRFHKSDAISAVQIDMGNESFDAVLDGSTVRCSIARVSGGIRIRNESVAMDAWIVRLLGALETEASHSDAARQALEHIVIGGTT